MFLIMGAGGTTAEREGKQDFMFRYLTACPFIFHLYTPFTAEYTYGNEIHGSLKRYHEEKKKNVAKLTNTITYI